MAEKPFQEKTEQATPKRLEEARRKGQIPRSRELTMAAVTMTGALVLYANSASLGSGIRAMMVSSLRFDQRALEDPRYMTASLANAAFAALEACAPLLAALVVAAIVSALAIGGWIFSPAPLAFKAERLNPVAGLGRMFSLNSLVEVVKALAKASLIGGFAVALLIGSMHTILGLSDQPLQTAMGTSMSLVLLTLALGSAALLIIGGLDAPYQLWNHARQLKMTRKEVEDELKETEGRPEVRSRVRAMQQEVARRRMLADVPGADVVVTNPTHFAVALRYDDSRMRAPVVLAKGTDQTAARIREIAAENRITLFESPLLARALYWTTDIGGEIPGPLYLAVAQVLTYVYRLKAVQATGGNWPDRPVIEVDAKLAERPQRRRRGRRQIID